MAVDLHVHSTASDGTDTPATIVTTAAEIGLSSIAISDHDTLAGIPEAVARGRDVGLEVIPGCELSVEWPQGTMHMLVYFLTPGRGPLPARLTGLQTDRETRNVRILERLSSMGIEIGADDLAAESGDGVTGRPHIAALLVRRGVADDIADAFDRFLARGRPGYVERPRLAPNEAIELAHRSGGVAVLAHPHTVGVGAADYTKALRTLADDGLDGVEAHYAEYPPAVRDHLAGLAEGLGLIPTGGSDYHGSYKPGLELGTGHGDLNVPDEVVERLQLRRPSIEVLDPISDGSDNWRNTEEESRE